MLLPALWSSGQSFWLLIMRSRVQFPVLPWGFFLEGEDYHGDHGLGSLVELRFKAPPGTSYSYITIHLIGRWRSWLRHCATSRKVAGSNPDCVIGILSVGRTMALGLTQSLTEMSTRNNSWGVKGVGLTTLPPPCADFLKIWEPQTPQTLRTCQGL
jgi:hypothetical protein